MYHITATFQKENKASHFFFPKQRYIVAPNAKYFQHSSVQTIKSDKNRLCLCSTDAKYSCCTILFLCSCQFKGNAGENKAVTKYPRFTSQKPKI